MNYNWNFLARIDYQRADWHWTLLMPLRPSLPTIPNPFLCIFESLSNTLCYHLIILLFLRSNRNVTNGKWTNPVYLFVFPFLCHLHLLVLPKKKTPNGRTDVPFTTCHQVLWLVVFLFAPLLICWQKSLSMSFWCLLCKFMLRWPVEWLDSIFVLWWAKKERFSFFFVYQPSHLQIEKI